MVFLFYKLGGKGIQLHVISTGLQSVARLGQLIPRIEKEVDFFHIRERLWEDEDYRHLLHLLQEKGVSEKKIIINDRPHIAKEMKAYGVQLPAYHTTQSIKKWSQKMNVGSSVHSVAEARQREEEGAHYLIFGHIFKTNSKKGALPRGLNQLTKVSEAVSIPVIAIGGINVSNMKDVINAGASGIAVMSSILLAEDPVEKAKGFRETIDLLKRRDKGECYRKWP